MTADRNDGPPSGVAEGESQRPDRSFRLILTLGGAGVLAGLLIVGVYQATLPAIETHRAAALAAAVDEVLGSPDTFRTLYLVDGELREALPEGTDPQGVERAYSGYRADGQLIGFALEGARAGFQDVIQVIFGYDPSSRTVLGMRVLRHLETPGLGDKIVTDEDWVRQFEDAEPPLEAVKSGAAGEPHEVDMITGATISARTVMEAINEAVERWHPLLVTYDPAPAPASRGASGGSP